MDGYWLSVSHVSFVMLRRELENCFCFFSLTLSRVTCCGFFLVTVLLIGHEDSPSMATPERQNYKKGGIVSLELCVNPIFKLFQTACIDIEQCKTKTEPQRCFQKKHLDIASRMNHCASWRAVDGKCDVKRFTHHCIAQRTLAFHCFGSVLL